MSENKELQDLPVKRVVFFKRQDGKYLTDNGLMITTDMILAHEHYISESVSYIVLGDEKK